MDFDNLAAKSGNVDFVCSESGVEGLHLCSLSRLISNYVHPKKQDINHSITIYTEKHNIKDILDSWYNDKRPPNKT